MATGKTKDMSGMRASDMYASAGIEGVQFSFSNEFHFKTEPFENCYQGMDTPYV